MSNLIKTTTTTIKSILKLLSVIVTLSSTLWMTGSVQADGKNRIQFDRIEVEGDQPGNGYFDISVEYGNDGIGWMAYSRVLIPKYVETHIAKSTDKGRTWRYIATANRSHKGKLNRDGSGPWGVWRNETPSLLYDPQDKPARRWKLYTQRYLTLPPFGKNDRLFERGWIEYQYAASPAGPWSAGTRLLGKRKDHCLIDPRTLSKQLENIKMFNEIGTTIVDGTIYLSMDTSTSATGLGKWKQRKIVLIASDDHGDSWRYVGALTNFKDAKQLGYLVLTGSSLFKVGNRVYMLASPSGAKGLFKKNRGHDGTLVLEFDDIKQARLRRDRKGRLVVLKNIKPERHAETGGLSDYHQKNVNGGLLFSQIKLDDKPEVFQIYNTGYRIKQ